MSVGVFWKKLAETYFVQDGSNIVRTPNLFSNGNDWFLIDPTVLQSNSGGPAITSSTAVLNLLRKTDATLTAPTANCAESAWSANGWDTGPQLIIQLSDWVSENFDNPALNINYNAMNLLYTEVIISGTKHILACCYFGNTGSIAIADGGAFTYQDYSYELVGYTFTSTIDNPQPVDGGLFVYT